MRISYATRGFKLTDELERYAGSKLARLNRKIPRRLRAQAACRVIFANATQKGVKVAICSLALTLPDEEFTVTETTRHMHSALDVAAVQIEQQLKDYAQSHRRWLFR